MHRNTTTLASRIGAALRPAGRGLHRASRTLRPMVLDAVGLGLLAAAAWVIAVPVGLAAAGIACIVLNWRLQGA